MSRSVLLPALTVIACLMICAAGCGTPKSSTTAGTPLHPPGAKASLSTQCPEPSFEGRGLSDWLAGIERGQTFEWNQRLDLVLAATSQEAVPWLVQELYARDGVQTLKTIEPAEPGSASRRDMVPAPLRRSRALRALARLGPAARPAFARACELLSDDAVCTQAARLLTIISPEAERVFCQALVNGPDRTKFAVMYASAGFYPGIALPHASLLACLTNKTVEVRAMAATCLSRRADYDASIVVPALISVLGDPAMEVRSSASFGLSVFGPLARPAVPRLLELLNDPDDNVRQSAHQTLRRIAPDALQPGK